MCELSVHVFRRLPRNQRVVTVRIIWIILINCMHAIRNFSQNLLSQLLLLLMQEFEWIWCDNRSTLVISRKRIKIHHGLSDRFLGEILDLQILFIEECKSLFFMVKRPMHLKTATVVKWVIHMIEGVSLNALQVGTNKVGYWFILSTISRVILFNTVH